MQSRQRRRAPSSRRTAARGVNRLSFGVQSMAPHVLAALGRTHDPANVDARDRARARRGLRAHQRRPHLRHAGRVARRLARDRSTARSRSASSHVSAYALTVEPATAARPPGRRRRAPRPTTTCRPTRTCSPTRSSPRPASSGTRCRTGRGPARSAATTSSTGARASTSGSAAPRTATPTAARWWNVRTPERYIAAIDGGASAEAGSEPSTRRRAPRRLRARAAHPRGAPVAEPRPRGTVDELAAGGFVPTGSTGAGRADPPRAGSWPPT